MQKNKEMYNITDFFLHQLTGKIICTRMWKDHKKLIFSMAQRGLGPIACKI